MFFLTILLISLFFLFIIVKIQTFLVGRVVAIIVNGIPATTSGKGKNTE
jgi:hypothetical protein